MNEMEELIIEKLNNVNSHLSVVKEILRESGNSEAFFEMAGRVPRDKSGRCKLAIAVGSYDGNIPHFHVFRSEKDLRAWKNGACLFFTENRYYDHSKNTETLTRDELKDLITILKKPYQRNQTMTNWQQLVYLWNDNNDEYEIPDDTPMPDYDYETITRYKEKDIDCNKNKELTPVFRVGDVVNVTGNPYGAYVINESVLIDTGDTARYVYEVSPIGNVDKIVHTCEESSLVFQYHDKQWEDYFTEGTRIKNDLPDWRGELYNFYIFYNDFGPNTKLDYGSMEEYNNDTIPPMYMEHILAEHSIYKRIDKVLSSAKRAQTIMKNLNVDSDGMESLVKSIKTKINRRNLSDIDPAVKKEWETSGKKFDFTGDELNLVAELDKIDVEDSGIKDHYPVTMTNLQIMKVIKEAYENAVRDGSVKMQLIKDKRIIKKIGEEYPLPVKPVKGSRRYRGVAKNGLVIEFWYNFDLNLIESAYPTKINNNSKKH